MMGLNLIFLDENDKVIVDAVINDEIVDAMERVFPRFSFGGIELGEKVEVSKDNAIEVINSLVVEAEQSACTYYSIGNDVPCPAVSRGVTCVIDGVCCALRGGKNKCFLEKRILNDKGEIIDTIVEDIRHKEYIDTDNVGRCKIIRKTAGRSEVRRLLNKMKKTLLKRKEKSFYIVIA